VLQTLERVHAAANSGRAGTALEVGMLQALTMHAMGQHDEALAQLDQALTQAPEPDQYARLFLAEGAPMLALLHAGGADQNDRSSVAVLARRLSQVTTATAEPETSAPDDGETTSAAAPLVDPLSDREVEVLRLLNSELTGPEIAAHLYVSLNTLRTHTKRIFTKLGVRNRAGAVRRGRELNLL
jgi:LuxR family maltose regulon positive regulatory protein